MREAKSVYKLHSMVNKNNLQHVGRASSGQQRKVHWKNHASGGIFPNFRKTSESALRDYSLLKWMMFWNRLKHSSAQQGSPPPPIQILTGTHQLAPRLPFSWSHLKKWLFSLPRGTLEARNSRISKQFLRISKYHGRPAPGARHRRAHFAIGLQGVFKIAPMAN